jgi:hypothetical protein
MSDRKRRKEDCDFQPPNNRNMDFNKRARNTAKAAARSLSRSTSGSTSSSCIDDSVGHMHAIRGDVLVGRCKNGLQFTILLRYYSQITSHDYLS